MNNQRNSLTRAQVVRIDGQKVRELRESQGLTQLYLATAVGVTTDTISRWENRRYPTIKRENALKLAKALEVDLEQILETEVPGKEKESEGSLEEQEKIEGAEKDRLSFTTEPEHDIFQERKVPSTSLVPKWVLWLLAWLLLAGLAWLIWHLNIQTSVHFVANRMLPPHCPPGQVFPVVINIELDTPEQVSLIMKEHLPSGCVPIKAQPPYTAFDQSANRVKWISQVKGKMISFCYLAQIDKHASIGTNLQFSGQVTVRKGRNCSEPVEGFCFMKVLPLHWADVNGDGKIDDEEILTVYDEFSKVKDLDFGLKQIEAIWAADGYRWDQDTGRYVIVKQIQKGASDPLN